MRSIDPAFAAALDASVATLCHCWSVRRRDASTLAFTDHDRPIVLGGRTYRPITALDPAESTEELGFAVSGGEVSGALTIGGVEEDDIARGLYDDARVEVFLVDWTGPERNLLLHVGFIGEILRGETGFTAELRGLARSFDEERGKLFLRDCSADLGDDRCGVSAPFADGLVTASDGRLSVVVPELSAYPDDYFSGGSLTFLRGDNIGFATEVKRHAANGGMSTLALWQAAPKPIVAGDRVRVQAGCDKSFATCRSKFGNGANFRGFPHIPGNDFIVGGLGREAGPLDGGSINP